MRIKRGTQKLKYNSKTNKIVCFRCGRLKKVLRSDTKFCSDLCRVQERNFRLENGFAKSLFEGKESELQKCYDYPPSLHKVNNPLVKDFLDIKYFLKTVEVDRSWKEKFPGFIVYHFPNNKLKPYQIYCTEDKFNKWKDYKEKVKEKRL
ncbi:MAG: hypothetical protein V4547_13855 [Bacteroidota bacterium]